MRLKARASSASWSMMGWACPMLLGLPTLMFLPPSITEFICSKASCAASGTSYSTKAKPLCFMVTESQDMSMLLMGPNGAKAWRIVSSPSS